MEKTVYAHVVAKAYRALKKDYDQLKHDIILCSDVADKDAAKILIMSTDAVRQYRYRHKK